MTACILSLEEELLNALMVICIFPSSFGEDPAAEVLDCQHSRIVLKSILRKLRNRGLLEGNSSTGRYALPLLVRSSGRAISTILGVSSVCDVYRLNHFEPNHFHVFITMTRMSSE